MKRILLLLLLVSPLFLRGQSIEWTTTDTTNIGGMSIGEEMNDGSLIAGKATFSDGSYRSHICKYDITGEEIECFEYKYLGNTVYFLNSIHDSLDDNVITMSNVEIGIDSNYILITVWDNDLGIRNEQIHYIGDTRAGYFSACFDEDNNIVVAGNKYYIPYGEKIIMENYYYKLDRSGDIILFNKELSLEKSSGFRFLTRGISFLPNHSGYICGGHSFRKLDYDLNVIKKKSINLGQWSSTGQFTLRLWSDSTYIFGSTSGGAGDNQGLIVNIIDQDFNSIDFFKIGHDYEAAFPIRCITGEDNDNMYLASVYNSYPTGGIELRLYNFNSDLDIQWLKSYRINSDYGYRSSFIISTIDGGCILLGRESNFDSNTQYPFIIKIKNDHVGTTQLPEGISQIITLYPNPSIGDLQINIQGEDNVDMTIYDMQGNKLKHINGLREGHNSFDNIDLPAGIYNVQLLKGSKQISTQRWVKM